MHKSLSAPLSFRIRKNYFSQVKYLTQIYVFSGFKNQFDWPQETYLGISRRQAARRATTEAPSVHHPQGKYPACLFCPPLLSSKIILCHKIKMIEAVGQEVQAVFHVAYLTCIKNYLAFDSVFYDKICFSRLVKYIFLRFKLTSEKPPPLKNLSATPHPTRPSTPREEMSFLSNSSNPQVENR